MSKRLSILIAIWLIGGIVLAACKPKTPATPTLTPTAAPTQEPTAVPTSLNPTQPAPALQGTIVIWHAWKENEIASLNEVMRGFQAQYPEVTFDVLYVPFDELRGKYEVAAANGGGPTLLIAPADWGPMLYNAALIADVSDVATPDFLSTLNPAALGALQYKGALIGLPQAVKGVVMYRNKAIIPETPKTFEELVAQAKAATQGDVVGANLEYGFFFSAAHITACGGKLMEANGDPAFNNEAGICWLNLLKAFQDAGPTEYYSDKDVNLFRSGKAGVIIDGTWNRLILAEAIGADNLAIDPWPAYGTGHLSGFVQTEALYLNANTRGEDRTLAWRFMQYFLSPEAQAMLANPAKAAHIPATLNVDVPDRLITEAAKALAMGTTFPVIPEMGAYWGPMDAALRTFFDDEKARPEAVLQEAFEGVVKGIQQIRNP